MKIKWGAFVVAGRGSAGGTVASRNTYGTYFRNKVTPINPSTVAQQLVRSFMATVAQTWRDLLQSQRDVWDQITSSYQTTDIFGDLFKYTGFNLFMKLNRNLLEIGESQITDAPAPAAVQGLLSLEIGIDIFSNDFLVTYTPVIDANTKVLVYATAPQSAGKKFVKSEYRKIDVMEAADVSPFDIITEYETKFGSVGSEGGKIFLQMRPIDIATGNPGTVISASTIVVDTTP